MLNLIKDAATCGVIQEIIAKSNENLSVPEVVSYLEPFMVKGSITPIVQIYGEGGKSKIKPLIPRLTANAHFLPSATVDDICLFISNCRNIALESLTLTNEVEHRLKCDFSAKLGQFTNSDRWLNNSRLFQPRGGKSYGKDILSIIKGELPNNYGNAEHCTSAEIIHYGMSFTDLSKAFYLLSDSQRHIKRNVSETFGIKDPDIFSKGLWAISTMMRNRDAHLLASYRSYPRPKNITKDELSFRYEDGMFYPWISTRCNLRLFYGRICFLVYITTNFSEKYQKARKEIKAFMLQMPKMTVNDLGLHSNWSNEPLWTNI